MGVVDMLEHYQLTACPAHQLRTFGLPNLIWKPTAVLTHQCIPLLLTKSALRCWMYQTDRITLSPTPISHPCVPSEWPYCQQAQWGRWFTVKHSKAGLQTRPDLKSSPKLSLLFAWITGPATDPGLWKLSFTKINNKYNGTLWYITQSRRN
jgi:hypothetical protein